MAMSRIGEPGSLPAFSGCTRGILCVVCLHSTCFNQPFRALQRDASIADMLQSDACAGPRVPAIRCDGLLVNPYGAGHRTPRHCRGARETVDGGSSAQGSRRHPSPRTPNALVAAARCAPGVFQSSPIDPDSSTFPGSSRNRARCTGVGPTSRSDPAPVIPL